MASSASVGVPIYKNRRGALIAFGVVELLIGAFLLLMAVMMAVILPSLPMPKGQPSMPSGLLLVSSGFYVLLAAMFITVGIGSIRARNWARIAMIAISSIWMAFGVLGTISAAIIMPMILRQADLQNGRGDAPPIPVGLVTVVATVFQAFVSIVLPLIFLLFYMSKNVKATCQGIGVPVASAALPSATAPVSPVTVPVVAVSAVSQTPPAPVVALSAWYLLTTVSVAGTVLWMPMVVVFGVVIRGASGRLVALAVGALAAFCAWGVYKLRIEGWWAGLCFSIFSLVSGLVTAIRLDTATFYDEIYQVLGFKPPVDVFKLFPALMTFSLALGVVFAGALLGLLIYAKRYFRVRPAVA